MDTYNYRAWVCLVVSLLSLLTTGEGKMVDLTHYLNKDASHYYLFRDFEIKTALNKSFVNMWVFANEFYMNEHTGTHVDAPAHTHLGGRLLHKIPMSDLVGPAVVFDLREKAKDDPDYALTTDDVKEHEKEFGEIEAGSIVLINTGGWQLYGEKNKYYGSETPDDHTSHHFPGFGGPASDFLIRERKIKGIGSDRMSFDVGQTDDFPVHYSISHQDTWGLENVNRVGELPPRGATIFVMPLLIENGSGAPSRIVAFTDKSDFDHFNSGSIRPTGHIFAAMVAVFSVFLSMM